MLVHNIFSPVHVLFNYVSTFNNGIINLLLFNLNPFNMSKRKYAGVISGNLYGVCPVRLTKCSKCQTEGNQTGDIQLYDWSMTLKCLKCGSQWTICTQCNRSKKQLIFNCDVQRHNNYHTKKYSKQQNIIPLPTYVDNNNLHDISEGYEIFNNIQPKIPQTTTELEDKMRSISKDDEVVGDDESGLTINALLLKALNQQHVNDSEELSPSDISLHTTYCNLAYSLTIGQRSLLANLVQQIINHKHQPSKYAPTTIPTTVKDIRSTYIDRMIPNLPKPEIKFDEHHAFVSVIDVLKLVFSFGYRCQPILVHNYRVEPVERSDQCKKAQDFLETILSANDHSLEEFPIIVTDWHDDFEPNSQAKQNRGSVWVYTITFVSPPDIKNKVKYSYPLAIGPKGVNHDHVIHAIRTDLKNLQENSTQIYHSGLKSMIPVRVFHLLSIADSPERRSKNYISLGNGEYSGRWGYAANVNSISNNLPYCNICLKNALENVGIKRCSKCLQWNFQSQNKNLSEFRSPLEDNDISLKSLIITKPKLMTFEYLRSFVSKVTFNLMNASISSKNAMLLLKGAGFSTELMERVKKYAKRIELEAKDVHENDPVIQECIPSQWKYKDGPINEAYIDPIMHLVFYGVASSCIEEITNYLKLRKKHASFKRLLVRITDSIISLKLEWCKLLPYGEGTFGGWVAENWVGYIRICKWVYSHIDNYEAPSKPMKRWTMKENSAWLKAHGLDSNGHATELRNRVNRHASKLNEAPGGDIKNVFNVLIAMMKMISLIMAEEVTETLINECDNAIKVFLSMVDIFDAAMHNNERKTKIWVRKSNFISLLNLPEQMRMYGPLRRYWEGGYRGEAMIQELKPLITTGLSKNWQRRILTKFYNTRAIGHFQTTTILNNQMLGNEQNVNMHHNYGSIDCIISMFNSHQPLSIIQSCNIFLIMINKRQGIQIIREELHSVSVSMHYMKWSLEEKSILDVDREIEEVKYCLLLPVAPSILGIYTCIDSNWNEISFDGSISRPTLSSKLYK